MDQARFSTIALLAIVASAYPLTTFASPSWARDRTQSRNGDAFSVVCSGTGASIDLARREAQDSCDLAAARQVNPEVRVTTLSVETESDSKFHQEIATANAFAGLTCIPKNEANETENDLVTVWLLCNYDLAAVKTTPEESNSKAHAGAVVNKTEAGQASIRQASPSAGASKVNSTAVLSIASVPPCKDVLVRGGRPRSIECATNPLLLTVYPEDSEIIVRASGFQPKHLKLLTGQKDNDYVSVVLERN